MASPVSHNQRLYPLSVTWLGTPPWDGTLGPPTTGILAAVEAQGLRHAEGQLFLMEKTYPKKISSNFCGYTLC